MKSKFTYTLFLLMSVGSIAFPGCQKTAMLNNPYFGSGDSTILDLSKDSLNKVSPSRNSSGGGGASGNGHNGGNGGSGGTVTTTDPSLAPTDTTTSQLPVAEIITVGKWKVTSFVQGKDNTTSQFATYIFTFNSDGTVVADDHVSQITGYWRYQEAVFYYGIPVYGSSPYGFTMTIGTSLLLTSFRENYFISKKTLTTINIDSVNPNENAHVTFSKLAQ